MDFDPLFKGNQAHFTLFYVKNCSTNVDFYQIRQAFLIHSLSLEATPNIDHFICSDSRKGISRSQNVVLKFDGPPFKFELTLIIEGFELIDVD